MRRFIISKNYKETKSAGNKAKTDIEKILLSNGFKYTGKSSTFYSNSITGFIITLSTILALPFILKRGDILVVQYPFKKYFNTICKIAHLCGAKVITVVHDLGSFRRKKLTVEKEIKRISQSDFIIVHNTKMEEWLQSNKLKTPTCSLEIFDYLSETKPEKKSLTSKPYEVLYAGALAFRKNKFLYNLENSMANWKLNLYGNGFEADKIIDHAKFTYKGFVASDELIHSACGDFGLVWDGDSIEKCQGDFGEYLKYNNPHKTSLYLRCLLPVIIWKEAALASFIEANKIGICINSIKELNEKLESLSDTEYQEMSENVEKIAERLSSGFYIKKAVENAIAYLNKSN